MYRYVDPVCLVVCHSVHLGVIEFFTHGRHDDLYASIVSHPNQHIRFCLFVVPFIYGSFSFFTHGRHDSVYGYVDQASVILLQPSLKRNQLDREVNSLASYLLCKESIGTTPQESKERSTSVQCRLGINWIC